MGSMVFAARLVPMGLIPSSVGCTRGLSVYQLPCGAPGDWYCHRFLPGARVSTRTGWLKSRPFMYDSASAGSMSFDLKNLAAVSRFPR
ncbi:Uncharacterised protein [Acinetobacter baumannii]|nr:Uncharacterised protein [Acinetobacter baumannii]